MLQSYTHFMFSKAVFIIFPKLETGFNTHYQNV